MTRGPLIAGVLALTGLLAPKMIHVPPTLLWNASASAPIGLYAVRPIRRLTPGEMVVIALPGPLARFAAERRYLPLGVPLIKPVAAVAGQTVCRSGLAVTIGAALAANARASDGRGRPLPVWRGCRRLGPSQMFVMNTAVPDSFDGRYFGPLSASAVLGQAWPLWTRPSLPTRQGAEP